ncbi:hypothetical protein NWP21_05455 [Anabaenopsis sp. FSS-46]|uniref:hypothetical protein n=1 Tax=Anabaenopsis sp. FSS-46 TaxID=2971766 RepID=UPI002476181D|nr:hypothetical protein [Anabaenopsis sp. FSS-46]MDH6098294.1 hypothetical protein [Anabaenopsis sp. FSS-46]
MFSFHSINVPREWGLDALDQDEILVPKFHAYSTYPASDRDIAFFAPVKVLVADIEHDYGSYRKKLN